jgi:V8-like Glu-specific endopeptidase
VLSLLYDESLPFRVAQPYRTVGRLVVRLNGQDFECSASVVRPHLVLTARHWVYDFETGAFATRVRFFPAWHSRPNATLHGGWAGRTLATWPRPLDSIQYDIGFIQTYDDDGRGCGGSSGGHPIEYYTGHLGVSWGGSHAQRQWNEFGYPGDPPFNGRYMIEAQSSTAVLDPEGRQDTIEVGNDMNEGSSGGPWILGFAPGIEGVAPPLPPARPGGNLANGLNSAKLPGHPLATVSPAFLDHNFGVMLRYAEGLACP